MATNDSQKKSEEVLEADPGNSSHQFDTGRLLWERGEKEKAVEHFVAAAKANPSDSLPFRYLGHYYRTVAVDSQRAAKCYQRAVTLNPDDQEAGEALCDLLDNEGKESLEVAVCKEASERSPKAFWAFRRLGYLLVHHRKWQEAVQSLQYAIRGFPACADLWEALGHAYHKLGMLTAALKSYGRSIELEDSRMFSLVESGNIHLMLGSFNKAVEHFRLALEISPDNISALFGIASSLLGLSKDCMRSGAFAWGTSLLKEASDVVKTSAFSVGNKSCLWKLYGDIQVHSDGIFQMSPLGW